MKITIEIDDNDPCFKKIIRFLDKLGGTRTADADDDKEQEDEDEENKDEENKDSVNGIEDYLLKQATALMHETENRILASYTDLTSSRVPLEWWDVSDTSIIVKSPNGLVSVGTFSKDTMRFSVFLSSDNRPYTPLLGVTGHGNTLYNAFNEFKARFQSKLKERNE